MKSYQARDARLHMKDILREAGHGEHVEIKHYNDRAAIVVPPGWYDETIRIRAAVERAYAVANSEQDSFFAEAIRESLPQDPRWVVHKDGNPRNLELSNLELTDPPEENER